MPDLTADQNELLQRAYEKVPMWDGSTVTGRLRRDVDLLLSLYLIEPALDRRYRITEMGVRALVAIRVQFPPKG